MQRKMMYSSGTQINSKRLNKYSFLSHSLNQLSMEVRQKLAAVRPETLVRFAETNVCGKKNSD